MRTRPRLSLLSLIFLFVVQTQAQQSVQPPPQRDPQALAVVMNSVAAMGGPTAANQVTDAIVTGTIAPSPGSSVKGGTFTWKTAGADFRYEKQSGTTNQVFASGHGRPASLRDGKVTARQPHIALANPPLHLPCLFLATLLADKNYSLIFLGKAEVNGAPAIKIHVSLETDPITALVSPQDWYFDALGGLPIRVEHRLPDSSRPEIFFPVAEEFSDFRTASGLVVPFRILSYENGALVATATVTSVRFNNGISPSEFDAPAGGVQ